MAKKRASQAPVLLAYVMTMLVCLVIFGSAAVLLLDMFVTQPKEQREKEQLKAQNQNTEEEVTEVDYSLSRRTILFVGAEGETINGMALVRLIPDGLSIKIVPIPTRTVAVVGSSTETIATHFENGGMSYLKTAIENTYGITCDKYIKITNDGWNRLVEYFGGTSTYVFPQDIYYKNEETGETTSFSQGQSTRTLWGDDIRRIITYPLYESGEIQTRVIAEVSTSLVNNACSTYKDNIKSNIQNIFNTIFNNSDTDITSRGFKESREALEYLVENAGGAVCTYKIPDGSWDVRGNFNASEECKAQLLEYFGLIEE